MGKQKELNAGLFKGLCLQETVASQKLRQGMYPPSRGQFSEQKYLGYGPVGCREIFLLLIITNSKRYHRL